MEPEGSLPHSQLPATCHYSEPAPSSPYPHIPLPEVPFDFGFLKFHLGYSKFLVFFFKIIMYWLFRNWFHLKGLLNFDFGEGRLQPSALPFSAPLWLFPFITLSHMHLQYNQLTTEPALGTHTTNLYCTINCHVKVCNGNYLQLTAMIDSC